MKRNSAEESMVYRQKWPLAVFLTPAFILLMIFLFYPFFENVLDSLSHVPSLGTVRESFVGPAHYQRLISDPMMRTALANTGLLMLCTLVFQCGFALVLAILVDSVSRGAQFFRTVFFFPIVISATALGLLFNLIFLYQGGMVNQFLARFGAEPIDWKSKAFAFFTMVTPVMWQYIGFYFVIILTGLNKIPAELYEAADIDGAGRFQRIRHVTLPMLHNVLVTCATLGITGALKVFDLPWTMFKGGMPLGSTYLTGTYMYDRTFNFQEVSYGAAIAVVIVLIGVLSAQITNAVFKPKEY